MQMAAACKAAIMEEMTRDVCQCFRKIMDILLTVNRGELIWILRLF